VPNLWSDGLLPATAEASIPDLLNAFLWSGSAAKEGYGDDALRLRAGGVLRGVAAVLALTSRYRAGATSSVGAS